MSKLQRFSILSVLKKGKKHYPTLINGCEPFPFFAIDKKPRNGRSKT